MEEPEFESEPAAQEQSSPPSDPQQVGHTQGERGGHVIFHRYQPVWAAWPIWDR